MTDDTIAELRGLLAGIKEPSCFWRHFLIDALIERQEAENATRPDFTPAIKPEMLRAVIGELLGAFDCRPSDTASAYAWMGVWRSLGVDFFSSKLVFLPRSALVTSSPDGVGE